MSNKEVVCRLQKLKHRGMRTILRLNGFSSRSVMLNMLKWLSVNQCINVNGLMLKFKIKNNLMPRYLTERLQ